MEDQMAKNNNKKVDSTELIHPHSNRKHMYNQVNGETQPSQTDIKTKGHKKHGE